MIASTKKWAWIVSLVGAVGCGAEPAPPAGTGAKEVVHEFFDALVRQDWTQSYGALHPETKKRIAAPQFARLAQLYHQNLGFKAEAFQVQSCDEKGSDALAHVVLTGHADSKQRRYKDAVVLRNTPEGWRVVLPDAFGRPAGTARN
jgi:hypothetical protein